MKPIDEDNLLMQTVDKALTIFSIERYYWFESIGLTYVISKDRQNDSPLLEDDREVLIQLLFIYRFLSDFCRNDVEFIQYWLASSNKELSLTPNKLITSREGLKEVFDYLQSFQSNSVVA